MPLSQRGLCWQEAGEFELALLDFRHSHSMRPSAAACNASGHAYQALRLLPQAIAEYQRVRGTEKAQSGAEGLQQTPAIP